METDVYKLLMEIREDIGHLKGTTEATLQQATKTNGRVSVVEKELNTLQTKVYTWAAIIGVGASSVVSLVAKKLFS